MSGLLGVGKGKQTAGTTSANIEGNGNIKGGRKSGAAKKQIKALNQEIARLRGQAQGQGAGAAGSKGGKAGGKTKGGMFSHDSNNNPICYLFAKNGRAACKDVCPNGRSHCCQLCLGPHSNQECELWQGRKGGKGGRK